MAINADRPQGSRRYSSSHFTLPGYRKALLVRLLRRSAQGDREAFAELYDATAPGIYGLILVMLGSIEQATEVAQDVFVEIWRTACQCDDRRPLTWMLVIAHRRALKARMAQTEFRHPATPSTGPPADGGPSQVGRPPAASARER